MIAGRKQAFGRRGTRLLLFACACAIASCSGGPRLDMAPPAEPGWRLVATPHDRARLRDWRSTFIDALARARSAGHGPEIAAEGPLLQPDSALGNGRLPEGDYRCRTIKIGAKQRGLLDYVAYPYFRCRVGAAGPVQSFAKLTGSQRQVGTLYPAEGVRQVFLGTLVLGDETRALRYGEDRERDVAAWVERIGPGRWRMVMPEPAFESRTDILELVPVS